MSAFIGVVVGVTVTGLFQLLSGYLEHRRRRAERRDAFMADTFADALAALDDAYQAAVEVATEADIYGMVNTHEAAPTDSTAWARRKPAIFACGTASFRLRRCAAVLPRNVSPRRELEAMAQAVADMAGERTSPDLLQRWSRVEPAMLAAREAVGAALEVLYDTLSAPARRTR